MAKTNNTFYTYKYKMNGLFADASLYFLDL